MSTVMTIRASVALLMSVAALNSCRRVVLSSGEIASRVNMSACPPGVPAATVNDAPPLATLTVVLRTEPAVVAGTEASLRLDGETTRNSLRVDAALPQPFTLAKGVYVVRVSLPGYVGVEGRASLTAGCEATMTMVLRKR